MSPESCTGFRDHYQEYKNLTNNYIQECTRSIATAKSECTAEAPQAVRGSNEEFQRFLKAKQNLDQSERELPKLQALLLPMDRLNEKLEDCLRDSRGKDIVNTNSDRGSAVPGPQKLGQLANLNFHGDSSIGSQSRVLGSSAGLGVSNHLKGKSVIDPGAKLSGESSATPKTNSRISNRGPLDRGTFAHNRQTLELGTMPGRSQAGALGKSRQSLPMERSVTSSQSFSKAEHARQIGSLHSNLFLQIRRRYIALSASFL